jgi:hypothetical protein
MKFHEYLEANYVQTNIDLQIEYSPYRQAKIQAIHSLLAGQKWFFRLIAYPIILWRYTEIRLGLKPAPMAVQDVVKAFNDKRS